MGSALNSHNIKKGRFIWWKFHGVESNWNCPAIIIWVGRHGKTFRIRSLDTMLEYPHAFESKLGRHADAIRKSMRRASIAEVNAYLDARDSDLEDAVARTKEAHTEATAAYEHFRKIRKKFDL